MVKIGIDVGYGYTKAIAMSENGIKKVSFPSLAYSKTANAKKVADLMKAAEVASIMGSGKSNKAFYEVGFAGMEYYIPVSSDFVLDEEISIEKEGVERYYDNSILALLLLGIVLVGKEKGTKEIVCQIATGLPISFYSSENAKQLKKLLLNNNRPWQITIDGIEYTVYVEKAVVLVQGVAVAFSYVFDVDGIGIIENQDRSSILKSTFAVIDVGMYTTDIAVFDHAQPLPGAVTSVNVAVNNILTTLSLLVNNDSFGVRQVIEKIIYQHLAGEHVSLQYRKIYDAIKNDINTVINDTAKVITERAISIPYLQDVENIIFAGGGAELFGEVIKQELKKKIERKVKIEKINKSELANATGYLVYLLLTPSKIRR